MVEPIPNQHPTVITGPVAPHTSPHHPSGVPSTPKLAVAKPKKRDFSTVPFWLGLSLSLAWIILVAVALASAGEGRSFGGIPLVNWAIGLSAIASPIALIWMITAYLQRASDVQVMTEPLRKQLNLIIGENGIAENRVRRFNAAIREQIELLRQGSMVGEEQIVNLLQQLAWEREEVKKIATQKLSQVHEAGKITHAAEQFDQILTTKLQQIQEIEHKLNHSNGRMAHNTEQLRGLLQDVLEDIQIGHQNLANSIASVRINSQELRDQLRGQETDILNAQANMKSMLGDSERAFDAILGRFSERSRDAESALEDAAASLEKRIGMLERAGESLPNKIVNATEQLNKALNSYQTIEESAQAAATNAYKMLDSHAQGITQRLDNFTEKLASSDQQLASQRQALSALLDQLSTATATVSSGFADATMDLNRNTDKSLDRFHALTTQVQQEVQQLTQQLVEATQRYETAVMQASSSAETQRSRLDAAHVQLQQNMTLLQSADSQSESSMLSMQARSSATLITVQNLESKLRDLYAMIFDASTRTQQALADEAVAHQDRINALGTAAETGVATLQRATQQIGLQHDGLLTRATQSEAQLQKLVQELTALHENASERYHQQVKVMQNGLRDTAELLQAAELQLQDFSQRSLEPVAQAAERVTAAAAKGSTVVTEFAEKLAAQAATVDQYEQKIVRASDSLTTGADKSNSLISTLLSNLFSFGQHHDELNRKLETGFEQATGKLNEAMSGLEQQGGKVASHLEQASARIAAQGQNLVTQSAENEATFRARLEDIGALHNAHQQRYAEHVEQLNRGLRDTSAVLQGTEERLVRFSAQAVAPVREAVESINSVVSNGETSAAAFAARLDQHTKQLMEFDNRFNQTHETVEKVTSRSAAAIGAMMADMASLAQQQKELQQQLESDFDRTSGKLGIAITSLEQQGGRAASQLEQASERLTAQGQTLVMKNAESEAALRARLEDITTQHNMMQLRYAEYIDHLNKGLQNTSGALQSTEERLTSFGSQTIAPVTDALEAINSAIAASETKATHFVDTLKEQSAAVGQYEEQVAQASSTLTKSADKSNSLISTLLSSLFSLGQHQDDLSQKLEADFTRSSGKLSETISGLEQQGIRVSSQLEQASSRLTTQGQAMVSQSAESEAALRARLEDISALHSSHQLRYAEHVEQLNRGLRDTATQLENTESILGRFSTQTVAPVTKAVEQITNVLASGEIAANSFTDSLAIQAGAVEDYEGKITQVAGALSSSTEKSNSLISKLLSNLFSFGQHHDELNRRLESDFTRTTGKLSETISSLEQQSSRAASQLEQASSRIGTQSQNLVIQSAENEVALRTRLEEINALHTNHQLRYSDHVEQLNRGLRDTNTALQSTEERLTQFHTQAITPITNAVEKINAAVSAGETSTAAFAARLDQHTQQLIDFDTRFSYTSNTVETATGRNAAAIGSLLGELLNLGEQQNILVQKVESRLSVASTNLRTEISQISNQTEQSVASLDQAQQRLISQRDLLTGHAVESTRTLDQSGEQIQNRASGLQETLQRQLGAIATELSSLESRFTTTGEQVRQQAESAYNILDRVGNRFASLTDSLTDDVTDKTSRLQDMVAQSVRQIGMLGDALQERLTQIGGGSDDIQQVADQLAQANDRIITQLAQLQSEGRQTGQSLQDTIASGISQLVTAGETMQQQQAQLRSAADQAVADLVRSGGSIEQQTARLQQLGQTHDTQIKLLNSSLDELDGKSGSLRDAMQQHTAGLVAQLQQGVSHLAQMSSQLQSSVTLALQDADTAQSRFETLTQSGGHQLQERLSQMQRMIGVVEDAMGTMRGGLQQQLTALEAAVQQIVQQQGALQNASSSQRDELVKLFDGLAQAHQNSALAAEQTISNFAEVTAQVSQSLLQFSAGATKSLNEVQQAGSGFNLQSNAIIVHSHEAAEQVRQVMSLTTTLADHARSLSTQTQAETARFGTALTELISQLDKDTAHLHNQTDTLLNKINVSSAAVSAQMADAVTNLQQCGEQMREQISQQAGTLRSIAEQETDQITSNAQQLLTTIETTGTALQNRARHVMKDVSQSGDTMIESIAGILDAVAENNARLRADMTAQATALREQAQRETAQINTSTHHFLTTIDDTGNTLRQRARDVMSDVSTIGDAMLKNITGLLDAVADNNARLRTEMTAQTEAMREQAFRESSQLAEAFSQVLHDIDGTGDRLRRQTETILATISDNRSLIASDLAHALEQFGHGSGMMREHLVQHIATLRQRALEETTALGDGLTQLLTQIDRAGEHVQQRGKVVMHDILQTNTAVDGQFGLALERLQQGSAAMREQLTSQIAALREQTLDEAQSFNAQFTSLISQISQGSSTVYQQTQAIIDNLDQSGNQITGQFGTLLQQIEQKNEAVRHQIAQHADMLQQRAADEADRFSTNLTRLLGQIDGSIGHLRFQNEDFLASIAQGGTQAKREFTEILSHIADNQAQIQNELNEYATALREQATQDMKRIAGDMTEMLERIDGSGDRLRQQVREAVGTIDLGGDALAQQVESLLERINDNHILIRSQMTGHAVQIRDEYAAEAVRMADGLHQVMSQLREVGFQLRSENEDVLGHLSRSAARFGETASQAAESLFDQIERLDNAANRVGTGLHNLGQQLQQEQNALVETGDGVNAHLVQMAARTAAAADQLRGLLAAINDGNAQTQGLTSHIAGQLQGMIIHLREEMQRLSDHSTVTAQTATHVVMQVKESTDSLMAAGAQIRREGTQLPQVIDIAEERLSRAAGLLREQADQAVHLLEAGAGHFTRIIADSQNDVSLQTQKLHDVAAQAGQVLRQFGHQLVDQLSTLQSGTDIMNTEQQKLVDQTAAAIAQLAVATDRLGQLRDGAESAHTQMLGKLQYMDSQAQATTKVLTVGSQALGQAINQLAETSSRAESQMMGVGAHYRKQLEELRFGLQQQLAGLHEDVAVTAAELADRAQVLQRTADIATRDLNTLLARFSATTDQGSAIVVSKTQELRHIAEDTADLLLGFGRTVDAQLNHLTSASTTIGATQHALTNTLDNSIRQVDVLQDKMENSRVLAQNSTEQVGAELKKLSGALQQHIENLGLDTQRAVSLVDAAGNNWQEQAQNLARIAQQARSELAAISYAIDGLQQKGEAMRNTIQNHGKDLMTTLNSALQHMENSDDDDASDDPTVNKIERGLKKIM